MWYHSSCFPTTKEHIHRSSHSLGLRHVRMVPPSAEHHHFSLFDRSYACGIEVAFIERGWNTQRCHIKSKVGEDGKTSRYGEKFLEGSVFRKDDQRGACNGGQIRHNRGFWKALRRWMHELRVGGPYIRGRPVFHYFFRSAFCKETGRR